MFIYVICSDVVSPLKCKYVSEVYVTNHHTWFVKMLSRLLSSIRVMSIHETIYMGRIFENRWVILLVYDSSQGTYIYHVHHHSSSYHEDSIDTCVFACWCVCTCVHVPTSNMSFTLIPVLDIGCSVTSLNFIHMSVYVEEIQHNRWGHTCSVWILPRDLYFSTHCVCILSQIGIPLST